MKRKLDELENQMSSVFFMVIEHASSDRMFFSYEEATAYVKYRAENTDDPITIAEIIRKPIAIMK